ncbi:alpha/beta hydrolase [Streptomyces chryseus]|uniref:Alpha/beta hydrolase n=1 Tax=Streptomyces chryseus TaxID=68186 RepID=A0ABQ3E665_9ACTN|nr:alpha/beta hydrolase [Streptomyces chryseus]GHB26296.1 alpha/beta hydrolase [Streptomyces chryseus]
MKTPSPSHHEQRRTGHNALRLRVAPPASKAAILLLHGGRSDALTPPPLLNLPSARMRPFGTAILKATSEHDVLLASVRYRYRGWNGSRTDPVHDAQEALDELKLLAPLRPVVLVGHSMGARAALRVAEHSHVSGVVALAPWCPPGEPVAHLRTKQVIIVHDEHDRVTNAHDSWDFVRRARRAGAQACGITMPRGGHAMLRDAGTWHRLTAALTAGILGAQPLPSCLTETRADDSAVVSAHRVLEDLPRAVGWKG